MSAINSTHDPALRSWVESANRADADFPIQNLPFGVFRRAATGVSERYRGGVAIGLGKRAWLQSGRADRPGSRQGFAGGRSSRAAAGTRRIGFEQHTRQNLPKLQRPRTYDLRCVQRQRSEIRRGGHGHLFHVSGSKNRPMPLRWQRPSVRLAGCRYRACQHLLSAQEPVRWAT